MGGLPPLGAIRVYQERRSLLRRAVLVPLLIGAVMVAMGASVTRSMTVPTAPHRVLLVVIQALPQDPHTGTYMLPR